MRKTKSQKDRMVRKDGIRSLFTFRPTTVWRNDQVIHNLVNCLEWSAELSATVGLPVSVKMQRSPKTNELALLVECGSKSMSFHSQHPRVVFNRVAQQVFIQIKRFHEQNETKERASRKASSLRHRRKSPTRIRSS